MVLVGLVLAIAFMGWFAETVHDQGAEKVRLFQKICGFDDFASATQYQHQCFDLVIRNCAAIKGGQEPLKECAEKNAHSLQP